MNQKGERFSKKLSWSAEAPSNIALIKYMGKKKENLPTNPSLSYTLHHLRSIVEVVQSPNLNVDTWAPILDKPWKNPQLSELGRTRFLNHWAFLKRELSIDGFFTVKSANNFPSDCGIASSASSFGALTLCAHKVAKDRGSLQELNKEMDVEMIARLSVKGSGSSCRSFFSPWAHWSEERGEHCLHAVDFPYNKWLHNVILISDGKKSVTSSEAHLRIQTSLLNKDRDLRAKKRMENLMQSLKSQDWASAFEVIWSEFWDMHALFETSDPHFGYMSSQSMDVLSTVRRFWQQHNDGPLVTMDAGPNIHLLYREDQKNLQSQLNQQLQGYLRL